MKDFDLVMRKFNTYEIRELQALCAKNIIQMLDDIDEPSTYQAAIDWIRDCVNGICRHAVTTPKFEFIYVDNSEKVRFYFNNSRWDKRYWFTTEHYVVETCRMPQLLQAYEDRWSDYTLLEMAVALLEGIRRPYETGREIPLNQYWEQSFEVDRVLWRLTTATDNVLIQRDTPDSANRCYIPFELRLSNIPQYVRLIQNACAYVSCIDNVYGPWKTESDFIEDNSIQAMVRYKEIFSQLLPGIIDDLRRILLDRGGIQ